MPDLGQREAAESDPGLLRPGADCPACSRAALALLEGRRAPHGVCVGRVWGVRLLRAPRIHSHELRLARRTATCVPRMGLGAQIMACLPSVRCKTGAGTRIPPQRGW